MGAVNSVCIIDPGMTQSFGHHYTYNHAFARAYREAGLPVRFFFNERTPGKLLDEYPDSIACFAWGLYQKPDAARLSEEKFQSSATALCTELQQHIQPQLNAASLVFAHTLDPTGLLGFALWYTALEEQQRPHLAVNLMLGVDGTPQCRARLNAACSLLRHCAKAQIFGGTQATGELLSALMGRVCAMLPTPLPKSPESYHQQTCPEYPIFGLVGDWRLGKNLQILPSALMRYLIKGGQGSFTIQMTPTDEQIAPVVLALHDLGHHFPGKVSLDIRYLDERAYYQNLASLTALIIPYTAESYSRYRPSGLVIESAAMAVPAICLQGGFMQEELAPLQNGSLFMPKPTVECLVEALFLFEREMWDRKALALAVAPNYILYHDIQRLLDLFVEKRA